LLEPNEPGMAKLSPYHLSPCYEERHD